jgi:uncharacterized protein HemX
MSSLPRFDNTWTIGNVLTLLALGLGGLGVYARINEQISVQAEILEQTQLQVQQLRSELDRAETGNEGRIRALELGAGRVEEKLIAIGATLSRIESKLYNDGGSK